MEVEHRRRRYWFARLCWPVTQHTEVTVSCVLFHSAGRCLRVVLIRFRFVIFERDTSDVIHVTSIPRPHSSVVYVDFPGVWTHDDSSFSSWHIL